MGMAPPQGVEATSLVGPIYAPDGSVLYDPQTDGGLVNASKITQYPLVIGTDTQTALTDGEFTVTQFLGPDAAGEITSTGFATVTTYQGLINAIANTGTYYLETQLAAPSSGTAYAELYDITAAAAIAGSEVSTTNTTLTILRSAAITLVAGHQYEIQAMITPSGTGGIQGTRVVWSLS